MNRKQLENLARELDVQLDEIFAMDAANELQTSGIKCRWTVRFPGMASGKHFGTLAEVECYLLKHFARPGNISAL